MKNSVSCWLGDRIIYDRLGSKEQESFNASQLTAIMSNWGYLESFHINGDKWGADMLFYRASDGSVLKVQLKGRPVLDKHYCEKDMYIAFEDKQTSMWYLYSHDAVMSQVVESGRLVGTESWDKRGGWSWSYLPKWLAETLLKWRI